jgi:hypothetical protein
LVLELCILFTEHGCILSMIQYSRQYSVAVQHINKSTLQQLNINFEHHKQHK